MRYGLSCRPAGTVLGPPAEKVSVPGRGDPSWAVGSTASARAAEHQNGRRQPLQTSQVRSHVVLPLRPYRPEAEGGVSLSLAACGEGGTDGLAPLQSLELATRRQCCLFSDSGLEAHLGRADSRLFQVMEGDRGEGRGEPERAASACVEREEREDAGNHGFLQAS